MRKPYEADLNLSSVGSFCLGTTTFAHIDTKRPRATIGTVAGSPVV